MEQYACCIKVLLITTTGSISAVRAFINQAQLDLFLQCVLFTRHNWINISTMLLFYQSRLDLYFYNAAFLTRADWIYISTMLLFYQSRLGYQILICSLKSFSN